RGNALRGPCPSAGWRRRGREAAACRGASSPTHGFPDGGDNPIDVAIAQAGEHREREDPLVGCLGRGTETRPRPEPRAVDGMKEDGDVMHVHANAIGPEGTEYGPAVHAARLEIEPGDVEVPGVRAPGRLRERLDERLISKCLVVALGDLAPTSEPSG